ncbi:hypothetical protein [Nostoc sp. LEGE 12447]|nr:hypothetical protein [Nostoc sp. LEGE 12447]
MKSNNLHSKQEKQNMRQVQNCEFQKNDCLLGDCHLRLILTGITGDPLLHLVELRLIAASRIAAAELEELLKSRTIPAPCRGRKYFYGVEGNGVIINCAVHPHGYLMKNVLIGQLIKKIMLYTGAINMSFTLDNRSQNKESSLTKALRQIQQLNSKIAVLERQHQDYVQKQQNLIPAIAERKYFSDTGSTGAADFD